MLVVGVLRRWTFWLILVAFLIGGVLCLPASVLALAGVLPTAGPSWCVLVQALLGQIQFIIGLLMLPDYRRADLWGAP